MSSPQLEREELEGLKRADDLAVHHGYALAEATWSQVDGAVGRVEAGYKVAHNVSAFAFGEVVGGELGAGVGVKWEF